MNVDEVRMRRAIALAVFYILLIPNAQAQSEAASFESKYLRLEALCFNILKEGTTPSIDRELRQIRDTFGEGPEEGVKFLIEKLEQDNLREEEHLAGKTDSGRIVEYWNELEKEKRTSSCKLYLAHILADMFSKVDGSSQDAILRTLVKSYTPSTFVFGRPSVLDWALIRTGQRSIPYFLEMANTENEQLRCIQAANLDEIVKEVLPAESGSKPSPPALQPSCNDRASPERIKALAQWRQWWEEEGRKLPFPELPSFFDKP